MTFVYRLLNDDLTSLGETCHCRIIIIIIISSSSSSSIIIVKLFHLRLGRPLSLLSWAGTGETVLVVDSCPFLLGDQTKQRIMGEQRVNNECKRIWRKVAVDKCHLLSRVFAWRHWVKQRKLPSFPFECHNYGLLRLCLHKLMLSRRKDEALYKSMNR